MSGTFHVLRIALAVVGLWAAVGKLGHFRGFVASVRSYRIVPYRYAQIAAGFVVMAEVGTAVGFLINRTVVYAGVVAILMYMLFALGSFLAVRRGDEFPCNCFGESDLEVVSYATALRASSLALASSYVVISGFSEPARIPADESLAVVLAGLGLAAMWRWSGLIPTAIEFITSSQSSAAIRATGRISLRHKPLSASLFDSYDSNAGMAVLPQPSTDGSKVDDRRIPE